jgi:hypothetical protein
MSESPADRRADGARSNPAPSAAAAAPARRRPARLSRLGIPAGWLLVWLLLVATLLRPGLAPWLLAACVANLLLFVAIERGRIGALSVQVRIAFLAWIAAGLWLPGLQVLLYVPVVGVAARLAFGYCLLARLVALAPWNRRVRLSRRLLVATLLAPPGDGPFRLPALPPR